MSRKPWQEIAQIAQETRDKSIALVQPPVPEVPNELPLNVVGLPKQLLSPREVEITETPAEVLVTKLASGEWTSLEITQSFLRRAGLAQKLVIHYFTCEEITANTFRLIVSLSSCLRKLWNERNTWTII